MKIKYIVLFSISVILVSSVMFPSSFGIFKNDYPILNPIGNHITNDMDTMEFTVTAVTDPNRVVWSFSLSNEPYDATIHPLTGEFSWSPKPEQVGLTFYIDITVNDGSNTDSETIAITSFDTHIVLHP